jgi:hypothetical protein
MGLLDCVLAGERDGAVSALRRGCSGGIGGRDGGFLFG